MPEVLPEDCLALVERSPALVAVHDKAGWLSLFARDSIVEDPVGSRPHSGGALARFYDTFIAANDIRFDVQQDFIHGLQVLRDLNIEITMAPGVVVRTPMHLLYQLSEEDGELKIRRLAAHWELMPMLRQQMGFGGGRLRAGLAAAWRMLRYLGPSGLLGFTRALSSVGARGKQRVEQFADAFNQGDAQALDALFEDSQGAGVFNARELLAGGGQLALGKTIAAGSFVSVSLQIQRDKEQLPGVALFELNRENYSFLHFSMYTKQP